MAPFVDSVLCAAEGGLKGAHAEEWVSLGALRAISLALEVKTVRRHGGGGGGWGRTTFAAALPGPAMPCPALPLLFLFFIFFFFFFLVFFKLVACCFPFIF